MDFSGLDALQQPGMACFAPLTCELLFFSSAVLGKWMCSAQAIPEAKKRSQIIHGCTGLEQFAVFQDQPSRNAQRGWGFASS